MPLRIVVLTKPVPDPAAAAERLGPGRAARSRGIARGHQRQRRVRARSGAQARRGARRRGDAALDGAAERRRDDAQGPRDGRAPGRPGHRPRARRLRRLVDDPGARRRASRRSSTTSSSRASTPPTASVAWSARAWRRCSSCRTSRRRRRSSPTPTAGTVQVRRISPTGFDVLEATMPARDRGDAAARRAALPVAQGDHGRPVEGGRDEVAGRPRARRRLGRRRRGAHEGHRHGEAAGAWRDAGRARHAEEGAKAIADLLASRRLI